MLSLCLYSHQNLSMLLFLDIENTDPYNHQMILDGTAKIEHEINANYALVSELIIVDRLHDDYDQEDDIYQQKVEVMLSFTCYCFISILLFTLGSYDQLQFYKENSP